MQNTEYNRDRIRRLKEELNGVIVAHNYQRPEVQEVADFVGDSLELSRLCADTDADTIIFCGVRFMAESAAILNPEKEVLLTDMNAGCPLADMVTVRDLREMKEKHPEAAVVCYINSSAAVKAESDCCCTSANAIDVVNSMDESSIIFVPDRNLGNYVSAHTEKRVILSQGYCYVHEMLKAGDVRKRSDAEVIVHPECTPSVTALADRVMSTSQMLRYVKESRRERFVIGTEAGMIYPLKKQNPGKEFIPLSEEAVCFDMKRTTIEKVIQTMEQRKNVVTVPEEIRVRAKRALDRMLEIG